MSCTALTELTQSLASGWQAPQKQDPGHATRRQRTSPGPGGGRKAELDLADRVLAATLQQNLGLPPAVPARPFALSKDTIRHTASEIRRLMDQHTHTPRPPSAHLNTLTGFLVHSAAHGAILTTETKPTC